MTIDRKFVLARLVEGEIIISRRVVPFPHRFYLDDRHEIEEAAVARLVGEGAVHAKPEDARWDRIAYRVASQFVLESLVREYWPHGFGHCETCNAMLAAGVSAKAPRHGANKQSEIPPCEGTGKPLVRLHLYTPTAESTRVA